MNNVKIYWKRYVKYENGTEMWLNGKGQYHRLEGPAIILGDTLIKAWYINGRCILADSQEEFENSREYKEYIRLEQLRAFE